MKYDFSPEGVCAFKVEFELEDNIVKNIRFHGGCNGNLKGVSALAEGMTVDEVKKRLLGTTCGFKNTSCPDQLAKALIAAQQSQNA